MTIGELFAGCMCRVALQLAEGDTEKYQEIVSLLTERDIPEDVQICLMKNAIALAKIYGE